MLQECGCDFLAGQVVSCGGRHMDITFVKTELRRQFVEERVTQTGGQTDATASFVLQHATDQIEERQVLWILYHDVAVQGFAVLFDVACGGAFFIPIQTSVREVLGSRSERGKRSQKEEGGSEEGSTWSADTCGREWDPRCAPSSPDARGCRVSGRE